MILKNHICKTLFLCFLGFTAVLFSCSDDDSSTVTEEDKNLVISTNTNSLTFEDTELGSSSNRNFSLQYKNLNAPIQITTTGDFQIGFNLENLSQSIDISNGDEETTKTIYVQFTPTQTGTQNNELKIVNGDEFEKIITLHAKGKEKTITMSTFSDKRVAFGNGHDQSAVQSFDFPTDIDKVSQIKMFVKLRCPAGGCDEWDVFANVKVKDPASGEFYEMGRFITPYWNDNSQLPRGFEYDVTDFKSLLTGNNELRIRTECWNSKGYLVSVEFDFIYGTPEYKYSAIVPIIAYDDWSSSGVPYGKTHNFDLDKSVSIPNEAEKIHLRSTISGWGHATPYDSGGRGCAEWCYRTHYIKINGSQKYTHDMGPIGCAQNPVSNQEPGNWKPDRAGWCPGMEVPIRIDEMESTWAGQTFNFEYDYENWTNNGANGDAFYATNTFVIVQSNTPINPAVIN
jgi:hypothetical protein